MPNTCIQTEDVFMGDAGEGLIDADARIQERMEELERERTQPRKKATGDPEQMRALESLRLARRELEGQLEATTHERRRTQIRLALDEVDRRAKEMSAVAR